MKIFSGTSNIVLATSVAHRLGLELSPLDIHIFPDGEKRVRVVDRVVDEHAVVIAPTSTPVDTNYMELFFIVDALKRSGAEVVTAVIPYLGYQRQDHVFRDGEAVSLEVVGKTLASVGTDSVIAIDLHTPRVPDIFPIPMKHLSALPLFAEKINVILNTDSALRGSIQDPLMSAQTMGLRVGARNDMCVLVSPDMGGIRRIKQLSEMLDGMDYAAIEKDRDLISGEVTSETFGEGTVKGKQIAFIVDDMISSGKTIAVAVDLLKKHGLEKIYVFASHAVFSEEAPSILQHTRTHEIFVTDTVYIPEDKKFDKLTVISVAKIIAEELKNS